MPTATCPRASGSKQVIDGSHRDFVRLPVAADDGDEQFLVQVEELLGECCMGSAGMVSEGSLRECGCRSQTCNRTGSSRRRNAALRDTSRQSARPPGGESAYRLRSRPSTQVTYMRSASGSAWAKISPPPMTNGESSWPT